jgi:glycosyltransferase involved in cell wall biosynthesis
MFVLEKAAYDPSVVQYDPPRDLGSRISRTWCRETIPRAINCYRVTAPAGLSFFTDDRTIYGKDPWQHLPENDLIHLHWIAGFVDYQAFFSALPPGKPLAWTLHGMEAFTGGCHYDLGCGKFAQECGACPQLGSRSASDLTRQVWHRKWKSYQAVRPRQLHVITPSCWLQNEVKRSSLLARFPCSVIPNALDTQVFAPRDQRVAREVLGVPLDAKVVLFIADGVHDPRKGFDLLAQALAGVRPQSKMFLLSLGPGYPPDLRNIPHVHVESIRDDRVLSYVYSAADVFVIPSLQENLPNTALESIACGTPVVGFAVGGIPDIVRPGLTGILAAPHDALDLRRAIIDLLANSGRHKEMAENCRRVAIEEYALEVQARRYLSVYQELLGRRAET